MDLNQIIEELKADRDKLAAAIESLERLAASRPRKRGRPPAWTKAAARKTGNADTPEDRL